MPNEFESISAVQTSKWKQCIKFDGRPIGELLLINGKYVEALGSPISTEISLNSSGDSSSQSENTS